MRYVLDASVALKWVLAEADSDKAIRIRDKYRKQIDDLVAPDFFPVECGHALVRGERKTPKLLTASEVRKCLIAILTDRPALHESLTLLPRAAAICQQFQTGLYDAVYVALAEREQIQLITADSKLVKKVQADLPFVVDLATFP